MQVHVWKASEAMLLVQVVRVSPLCCSYSSSFLASLRNGIAYASMHYSEPKESCKRSYKGQYRLRLKVDDCLEMGTIAIGIECDGFMHYPKRFAQCDPSGAH
ncbi:hypothetical protein PIB30_064586 [Stylosanthes scabra]|uniref:Uncharacterized protein n=1 Tax=Stylosanthes scabra TaxID=79078 RepID=A0ABU6WLP8_9FABA|nr:hypothetical protein [Stylosanthes scabra]